MDLYHINMEKMSNFDLNPLTRHSPSKSTSGIDQYTHHHGKGDSAYSSFSGGSMVPEYPSSFLMDDLHQQPLHYTDLKYVKTVCGPGILDSGSKSMARLYRSTETIVPQCDQSPNESPRVWDPPTQIPYLPPPPTPPPPGLPADLPPDLPPPPPPVYLDTCMMHSDPETSVLAPSPKALLAGVSSFRNQTSEDFGFRSNLINSLWVPQNSESAQDFLEKSAESRSAYLLPEKMRQPERLHDVSLSVSEVTVSEQQHAMTSWHMTPNTISGSLQHKGAFYYITGVCKSSESNVPLPSPPSPPPPPPQGWTESTDAHTRGEMHRFHNTVENMLKNVPVRKLSGRKIFFEERKLPLNGNKEPSDTHHFPRSLNGADMDVINTEAGRYHINNHPVFYCSPEEHFSVSSQQEPVTPVLTGNKPMRQALPDLPTEKISKETTPLLYQLTGASRALARKSRNHERTSSLGNKQPNWSKDHQEAGQGPVSSTHPPLQSQDAKEEKSKEYYYLCSTMDDSFKKYYKEKLKDAQSKVLRETSFKRKDLGFSWEKAVDHCWDRRPSGITSQENPSPTHPQEYHFTDALTDPSHKTEKETVKQQNVAQPQVPRVGCRKRLTLEQKKLSNSEPEKLHRIGDGRMRAACRSLGSEIERLHLEEERSQVEVSLGKFNMRERAMSACSFSKSTLKHFQQNALMAYIQRKTGHKVAGPQQPVQQVTSAARHSDWGTKPYSESREKPLRPRSASHIHDSIPIRYAQLPPAQHSGQSCQNTWKEQSSRSSGKSASVEDLLEEIQRSRPRSCSTSTPHSFYQNQKHFSSAHAEDLSRAEIKVEGKQMRCKEYTALAQRVRMVASRGKSLEEVGTSVVFKPKVLSKSSDQLNEIQRSQLMSEIEYNNQLHTPLDGSEETVQISSECRVFQAPGLLARTHAAGDSRIRISSSVLGKEYGSVPATPSFQTENNEDHLLTSKMKALPKELFLTRSETSHGDVHDVHFRHGIRLNDGVTTQPNLWPRTTRTEDEKTCEHTTSQHAVSHYAQHTKTPSCSRMDSGLEYEWTVVDPVPVPGGAKEGQKKAERKCPVEALIQEVVSADQSLARVLYPIANRKTAVMLMEHILFKDNRLMGDHYEKKKQQQNGSTPEQVSYRPYFTAALEESDGEEEEDELSGSSVPNNGTIPPTIQQCALYSTGAKVTEKKRQLMAHIEEQLKSMEGLRSSLQAEENELGILGKSLQLLVHECCLPTELERFTQFIEDLERVISLLLCLSARLARVQNAMSTVDENMDLEEKESLLSRHRLLCKQWGDATDLKDNLERRERMVSTFLAKQLTEEQLQEYRRFIQIKTSILIRQKDLDEKQRLGEEHLNALLNSIPP